MPTYEYRCPSCGHVFEHVQKITDNRRAKCPRCRKSAERQISSTSFILKGSGWYKTDYASKGSGAPKESPKESSKEGSSAGPASTLRSGAYSAEAAGSAAKAGSAAAAQDGSTPKSGTSTTPASGSTTPARGPAGGSEAGTGSS